MGTNSEIFLQSTFFVDSESDAVKDFAARATWGAATAGEQAAALIVAVRDEIRYDPYCVSQEAADYRASRILGSPSNWCVPEVVLLAAAARASGIPCKLGFADVRNRLTTPKLEALMGTDLFVYHGYVEWLVEGSWSKVTPAFNSALCARHGVSPLSFEVGHHALMHEFDGAGHRYMEYVQDHGTFLDLPFDEIISAIQMTYGGRLVGSTTQRRTEP